MTLALGSGCASNSLDLTKMGMGGGASPGPSGLPMPPTLKGVTGPWGEPVHMVPPVGPMAPGAMRGIGPEVPQFGQGMPPMPMMPNMQMPMMPPNMGGASVRPMGMPPMPGPMPGAIPPVPTMMSPQGKVFAQGALMGPGNQPFPIKRSQVRFAGPAGAKIGWYAATGVNERDGRPIMVPHTLDVPGRYNFLQASIYRLKISEIPGRPGELYPTLEVVPANPKTDAFLNHNAIPVEFTEEDFDQVTAGNFITKVIYLPDAKSVNPLGTTAEELSSTRLEPGMDPIAEAYKRGHILLIVRLGGIHLEAPNTPALDNPGPFGNPQAPRNPQMMQQPMPNMPPLFGVASPTPLGQPEKPRMPAFAPPTKAPFGPVVPAQQQHLPPLQGPVNMQQMGDIQPAAYVVGADGKYMPASLPTAAKPSFPMTSIPAPTKSSSTTTTTKEPEAPKKKKGLFDGLFSR
jgi:hypothetical protein